MDEIQRLQHHRLPILPLGAEQLHVGLQAAGPDAHQEAPVRQMIEQGGIAGNCAG